MTIESRVQRLENAFIQVGQTLTDHTHLLTDHTRLLTDHTRLLNEHSQLLRDIVTLLNAQGGQLERIERAIRERGQNGQQP